MSASAFENELQSPKHSNGLVAAVIVLIFALVISLGALAIVSLRLSASSPNQQAAAIEAAFQSGYDEGYASGASENVSSAAYDKLAEEHRIMEQSYESIKEEYFHYKQESDFWSRTNVIVSKGGTKYHAYGCEHISGCSYDIYDVKAAQEKGYEPCLTCSPPTPYLSDYMNKLMYTTPW